MANGPCSSRHATMRCAVAGPTPGRVSSAATSAWLRRTIVGLAGRCDGRRVTAHRHHHLLAVGHRRGQVKTLQHGLLGGAAGGRDGVAGARPGSTSYTPG